MTATITAAIPNADVFGAPRALLPAADLIAAAIGGETAGGGVVGAGAVTGTGSMTSPWAS
jgi:hypothetical protein